MKDIRSLIAEKYFLKDLSTEKEVVAMLDTCKRDLLLATEKNEGLKISRLENQMLTLNKLLSDINLHWQALEKVITFILIFFCLFFRLNHFMS